MDNTIWLNSIFSVRGRLLLAFLGICALAGFSAAATLFSFESLRNALVHVTQERAPVATDALELSRQAERIAAAAPLILAQSGKGSNTPDLYIQQQIDRLKVQLNHLEERQFTHESLYRIRSLVNLISLNLEEFEHVVQRRELAHKNTLQLQKDFSALLVRLQRPLFPAMVLLDSKVAQLTHVTDSNSSLSLTDLASELGQLQRVEKIMLETTSISDKLNGLVTETSRENLDIVIFPMKRSAAKTAQNIKQLGEPYRSELDILFPEFNRYIQGEASLLNARKIELEITAHGEKLLEFNRDLSVRLTVAVDQLVNFAKQEIEGATDQALKVQLYGKKIVITMLILTLLSSLFIVWFLVEKNLIRRINTLHTGMLAIAGGDLNQHLPPKGNDELGRMAEALTVFRDTARVVKQSNLRELRQARDQAEQASRMKSEFLANMSHELRTPLNAVIGITEMLLEDARDKSDSEIYTPLERISGAGRKLLRMINELLDLAKIESDKMGLNPDHTDIYNAVAEVVDASGKLVRENGNEISFKIESNLEMIYVDPMRLRQILSNLISNACKFTHNGKINIKVYHEDVPGEHEFALFEVSDTGIGIETKYLPDIFREFMQSDGSTTRRYGGTGLGLAISQRLSRIMGGSISVVSTPDEGSVFTLKLPMNIEQGQRYYNSGLRSAGGA